MDRDEAEIRALVHTWMTATREGDVDRVLDLMADDVVFLVPGRAPMRKPEFASLSRPRPGQAAPAIDGSSDIQEIQVMGDWAFMWTSLSVVVTPPDGPPIARAGHTLSILKKQDGRWLMARDANLLSPVPRPDR